MAHRPTGSAEDAVGTDWKFGIRKENIFLKPPGLHNPMFGLSSSLSRVRYAAHKSSAPWTTPGDRREPSGYEGQGVSRKCSPSLFQTSSRYRLHLQLSLSADVK